MGVRAGMFFTKEIAIRPLPPVTDPNSVKLLVSAVRFTLPDIEEEEDVRGK